MESMCRDIDFLLVGKTGVGKSATGNSILGRNAFRTGSRMTSVTQDLEAIETPLFERKIKVIDTPGLDETEFSSKPRDLLKRIVTCLDPNPDGYNAVLLVMQYGQRFTEDDLSVVKVLKNIFGESFFKDHVILILTGGELFAQTELKTFASWCNQQSGIFEDMYWECRHRAVLFSNMTKDGQAKSRQLDKLLKCVEQLPRSGSNTNKAIRTAKERFLYSPVDASPGKESILSKCQNITIKLSEAIFSETKEKVSKLERLTEEMNDLQKRMMLDEHAMNNATQLLYLDNLKETVLKQIGIQKQAEKEEKTGSKRPVTTTGPGATSREIFGGYPGIWNNS